MVMPTAWVLNLDADDELRHPEGYTPTAAVARRVQALARHLQALARPGDVILEGSGEAADRGLEKNDAALQGRFIGQAWCPTPSALRRLQRAGALLPATPPLQVLRHVNHRAFCAQLGQTLERARYVEQMAELQAHVEQFPGCAWVLKRPHGFSGRGSRRVAFPNPDAADLRWIEASLRHDAGLQVEPWVARLRDFAMHGYIDASGTIHLGEPTVQECGPTGAWVRTLPHADLEPQERDILRDVVAASARALIDARYFGPFGIDAYRWRDATGQQQFNPRSEINARYSMGWHVGMGKWRPDLQPEGM